MLSIMVLLFKESSILIDLSILAADTGEIRLLGTFDHETRQLYQLTVSVTDQGGLESTAIVDIHVTDVNDNEPRFTESLYQFSVCENEPTGERTFHHFLDYFV